MFPNLLASISIHLLGLSPPLILPTIYLLLSHPLPLYVPFGDICVRNVLLLAVEAK